MNPTKVSERLVIYWDKLSDEEVQNLINACETELELRSQADMKSTLKEQQDDE